MSKCGHCTLCCKLLAVEPINKPKDKWCQFCTPGKGCNIYDNRPVECRNFECGYLLADLPIQFRPDNLHIVITGYDNKKLDCAVWHCDPAYPNAIDSPDAQKLVELYANQKKSILLVIGSKRRLLSHSIGTVERVQKALKELEGEIK